ncbi:MAG: 16S rRNA (guanine(527)-N(7))-methyltransferase RsmG [candidate division KSB1 bacterium]|nr:16S rRNA (guanine(527)-N(7))-methyltransferase RsmG [candidate division KSB1 bacterium]MDQ7065495.1 16S rRNA (guanine(527)-N(7))-methyltransferase RsmG [candidate division KSB1 bacterium]
MKQSTATLSSEEKEALRRALAELARAGVDVPDKAEAKLTQYVDWLLAENRRTQLVSRKDESFVVRRHIVESLAPLTAVRLCEYERVIDLGSGAGLPGIPLAVVCPSVQFDLLDSKRKRILFLKKVEKELDLRNVTVVLGRAEDRPVAVEADAVIARAVAPLPELWQWAAPYLRPFGRLLAMKGGEIEPEIRALQERFKSVAVEIRKYSGHMVPHTINRFLVVVYQRA